MILLDTNVLSELMRSTPNENVVSWIGGIATKDLYITSITQAEILYGLGIMDAGARKRGLLVVAQGLFAEDFAGRILPFDSTAAERYAEIATQRRSKGRPISHADAQIASIAHTIGFTLATRNVSDFEDCGVEVVNPFDVGTH
jgi:predicted nucleic acid-binding protein